MLGYLFRLLVGTFKICRHKNWTYLGKLEDSEFPAQRCKCCGWIQYIPPVPKPEEKSYCKHNWMQTAQYSNKRGDVVISLVSISKCVHCCELKRNEVAVWPKEHLK